MHLRGGGGGGAGLGWAGRVIRDSKIVGRRLQSYIGYTILKNCGWGDRLCFSYQREYMTLIKRLHIVKYIC